ncbi:MAG TPA: hypothetical protein DEH78_24905 [Solibacterales bacterium]|nr:hypothetical protein [Bryobacterales bacterium]
MHMESDALLALIRLNRAWLAQAAQLVGRLTGAQYRAAGPHFRHILEFYGCFLDGLPSGEVDYDARRRDSTLERDPAAALTRIADLAAALASLAGERPTRPVAVRMEDASGLGLTCPWLPSSLGRELQSLSSHTVHHFAIIALTLRPLNVALDAAFGVAPSTLRHANSEASQQCAR